MPYSTNFSSRSKKVLLENILFLLLMKRLSYLLVLQIFIFFPSCKTQSPSLDKEHINYLTIDFLIEQKNFFAAREKFQNFGDSLSQRNKILIEIFLLNAFNKPGDSNARIDEFLEKNFKEEVADSLLYRIKTIALDNSIKTFEYARAKLITEDMIENFAHVMSDEKLKDHHNTYIIWTALMDQPKQEVAKNKLTEIPIVKDKAGLQTIRVEKDSIFEQFVFDTGANFSTITESTAEIFGLNILHGFFEVNSISGAKILSQIAVAPELLLGDIVIKNAVFLVFPDDALGFKQIDYQINGILGFPVIEALKEIQITRDGKFIVPLTYSTSPENNLAIDFLTPLILIEDQHGSGTYTFDTGAGKTMLYNTYFDKFLSTKSDTLEDVEYTFGGAGGTTAKNGVYIPFNARIGPARITLDSVMVLKEVLNPNNLYLGNIGQDVIGKFEKMTLNFDKMFIRFD